MIIKAQKSVGGTTVLIYNKDRSVFTEMPCQGAIETAIGDRMKAYFEATIDESGMLKLHREVSNQKW